jgi:hypothetical protein
MTAFAAFARDRTATPMRHHGEAAIIAVAGAKQTHCRGASTLASSACST